MTGPRSSYRSYLLRLWQTTSGGEWVCRASLESAQSGKRMGFATLDDLFGFLRRSCGAVRWEENGDRDRERR
jgi:hypothetical protein